MQMGSVVLLSLGQFYLELQPTNPRIRSAELPQRVPKQPPEKFSSLRECSDFDWKTPKMFPRHTHSMDFPLKTPIFFVRHPNRLSKRNGNKGEVLQIGHSTRASLRGGLSRRRRPIVHDLLE